MIPSLQVGVTSSFSQATISKLANIKKLKNFSFLYILDCLLIATNLINNKGQIVKSLIPKS